MARPRAVEVAIAEGALLIDARTNEQFDEGHIPGAISASAYDTGFATKVATVVPTDVELIVVAASDGYELEAAELLASVGLQVRGYLHGGMTSWRSEERPVQRIELIERHGELPRDRPVAAVCSGGKRSGMAASILQREGFESVIHVAGGMGDLPKSE